MKCQSLTQNLKVCYFLCLFYALNNYCFAYRKGWAKLLWYITQCLPLHCGKICTTSRHLAWRARCFQSWFVDSWCHFLSTTDILLCLLLPFTVGPGEYESPVFMGKSEIGLICSKGERFKPIKSQVPGPGAYQVCTCMYTCVCVCDCVHLFAE